MSNQLRILPALLCSLLALAAFPAAAPAVAGKAQYQTNQSRLGRGFGRRSSPSFGRSRARTRSRYPSRARRPFTARRFFGGVLKALGLAYLFHLMFGWGAGGSPFGLLLLVAIVLFMVTRRRSRRPAYY